MIFSVFSKPSLSQKALKVSVPAVATVAAVGVIAGVTWIVYEKNKPPRAVIPASAIRTSIQRMSILLLFLLTVGARIHHIALESPVEPAAPAAQSMRRKRAINPVAKSERRFEIA